MTLFFFRFRLLLVVIFLVCLTAKNRNSIFPLTPKSLYVWLNSFYSIADDTNMYKIPYNFICCLLFYIHFFLFVRSSHIKTKQNDGKRYKKNSDWSKEKTKAKYDFIVDAQSILCEEKLSIFATSLCVMLCPTSTQMVSSTQ